jgi:fluoroacetyl-CoA thioesterase
MNPTDRLTIGMSTERTIVITREMTIGYFVPGMPSVYATPMMILDMEMAAGEAICQALPPGYVSVGMDVKVRHLKATPVGQMVRILARVISIEPKSVLFEVEAWNESGKIGDGTHRRGVVNVPEFERRLGMQPAQPANT